MPTQTQIENCVAIEIAPSQYSGSATSLEIKRSDNKTNQLIFNFNLTAFVSRSSWDQQKNVHDLDCKNLSASGHEEPIADFIKYFSESLNICPNLSL